MKRKLLFIFFLALLTSKIYSQIAITEVYYDTPFLEYQGKSGYYHNAGEYIELFNYTTQDIDIGGWILKDLRNSYIFNNGVTIKSGEFLILRYHNPDLSNFYLDYNTTWSKTFFPTTIGQESKILPQNNIVLGNYSEAVFLYMTKLNEIKFTQPILIHKVSWNYKKGIKKLNPILTSKLPTNLSFYEQSLQITNQEEFYKPIERVDYNAIQTNDFNTNYYRRATPLSIDFEYQLMNLEDIPIIKETWLKYEHFGSNTTNLINLINNTCDKEIPLITYNLPTDTYLSKKCFQYDLAGNYIAQTMLCNEFSNEIPRGEAEEENLKNEFTIAPNPVHTQTTLYWTDKVKNQISSIDIIPINNANIIPINFSSNQNSVTINIGFYSSGIYVVRFTLSTGKVVSKNLIKL